MRSPAGLAAAAFAAMAAVSGCGGGDPVAGPPVTTKTNFATSADSGAGVGVGVGSGAGAGAGVRGANTNPDGVPYPTPAGGYGHAARRGKTPGSVIQNFKFLGYPNANPAGGLQTIALADYYDPCNKRLKVLHLSVAAVWCTPCNEETVALVASKAKLDSEQVVLIQALSDGPTMNVGATQSDLNYWIKQNQSNFTEMLDPNLANLGTFFDAAAVPWNADIDPRTMEILDDGTGWAGTVDMELAPGIAAAGGPPGYPVAIACP
jgi:hypothetical protein